MPAERSRDGFTTDQAGLFVYFTVNYNPAVIAITRIVCWQEEKKFICI
jgi:hypothetical protein